MNNQQTNPLAKSQSPPTEFWYIVYYKYGKFQYEWKKKKVELKEKNYM